jgi:hypothetical protein
MTRDRAPIVRPAETPRYSHTRIRARHETSEGKHLFVVKAERNRRSLELLQKVVRKSDKGEGVEEHEKRGSDRGQRQRLPGRRDLIRM